MRRRGDTQPISAERVTEPIAAPAEPTDEAEHAPTTMLSGIGPIDIDVPAPGAISASAMRGFAAEAIRLVTLSRSARAVPRPILPVVVAGWAAAVGLLSAALVAVVVAGTWEAAAAAGWVWLAAHHAPLETTAGTVTLLPMALLLVAILPLRRAARFVVAQVPPRHVRGVAGIAGVCYVTFAAVVAAARTELPDVSPGWAAWWAAIIAGAAGWWGIRREDRGGLRLPVAVTSMLATVWVPLAIGLMLLIALLAGNAGAVIGVQQDTAGSGLDQVGLSLLQLGYLPNFVVWAGAFVVGSGVAVGSGGTVSPYASAQPVLPDLPLLQVVPGGAPNWTALLPITVAVSGAVAAVLFARHAPEPRLGRRIARVLMLALGSGLTWWLLGVLAGGGIGAGRLAAVGPAAGTGLLAGLLTAAGGMLWALLPTLAADARPVAVDLRTRLGNRGRSDATTSA